MKKYSFLLVCLFISIAAMSQKAVMTFQEKEHDFGKINEKDGNATYVFKFTNKGDGPLVITNAQAQCGCTTPVWTKEPISAGKTGSITVTYNTAGRSGIFDKNITVYCNGSEEQIVLKIKGEVIPKPVTPTEPVAAKP